MNLSSLYKPRFTKDDLLKYTHSLVNLITSRVEGTISREELTEKFEETVNKFLKKYGE